MTDFEFERMLVESNEIEFQGIETGEESTATRHRPKPRFFRNCLVAAFFGTLAANGLFLTFFGIPIAIGWHFALLWICLAWSVLGTGSLLNRSGAAFLVWSVGTLPFIPILWLDFWGPELPHPVSVIFALSFSSYAAFWCYRVFGGSFVKLAVGEQQLVASSKTSLLDLFRLMTVCAVLLGIMLPIIKYFSGAGNYEILRLGTLVVPNVLLLPTIRLSCGVSNSSVSKALKYLLILCATLGVTSVILLFLLGNSDFGAAFFLMLIGLLIYFSGGGFLIGALSSLRDHGYRFGREVAPNEG